MSAAYFRLVKRRNTRRSKGPATDCHWCGRTFSREAPPHPLAKTRDHVHPKSKGGPPYRCVPLRV